MYTPRPADVRAAATCKRESRDDPIREIRSFAGSGRFSVFQLAFYFPRRGARAKETRSFVISHIRAISNSEFSFARLHSLSLSLSLSLFCSSYYVSDLIRKTRERERERERERMRRDGSKRFVCAHKFFSSSGLMPNVNYCREINRSSRLDLFAETRQKRSGALLLSKNSKLSSFRSTFFRSFSFSRTAKRARCLTFRWGPPSANRGFIRDEKGLGRGGKKKEITRSMVKSGGPTAVCARSTSRTRWRVGVRGRLKRNKFSVRKIRARV